MKAGVVDSTISPRERIREEPLSNETYRLFQRYIKAESGIVLEADKLYLVESRLKPVLASEAARSLNIHTLDDLCHSLIARPCLELGQMVLDAMTTNETFFFRDAPLFETLQTSVLPSMFERLHGQRKLRIWSAASSSGQEAYSLAMVARELGKSASDIEILGTDLSTQMIERARQGKYASFEVGRGLPVKYLERYFIKSKTDWQAIDAVRSMVRFEQIDLRRSMTRIGEFDLILCRNVLIYFDTDTKKKVVTSIKNRLAPGGLLALGCAETIININDSLHRQQVGASTFYTADS